MSDRDPIKHADSRVEFDTSEMIPPDFDLDSALNKKGFAEFLAAASGSEAIDMEDAEQIREHFEVFTMKESSKIELNAVFKNHIKSELGISLGQEELSLIDKHLERQAIEDPKGLEDLKGQLNAFRENPKVIAQLEQTIAQFGTPDEIEGILQGLRKDRADLDGARDVSSRLGRMKLGAQVALSYVGMAPKESRETKETLACLDENYEKVGGNKGVNKILDRTDRLIITYEKQLALIKQAQEAKATLEENFNKTRSELLAGITEVAGMKDQLQKRAEESLEKIMKGGSIKDLEKAQKQFERFGDFADSDEAGFDPLENIDVEEFQEKLDESLQNMVFEEISKAIEKTNMGTNALSRLETALLPMMKKEKVGSLEGDDRREFFEAALQGASDRLGDSATDKAKRLMIARIISKLNQ